MQECVLEWSMILWRKLAKEKDDILGSVETFRLSLFLMKFSSLYAGMCAGMIYNLWRKLTEDKEDILASREKSLASLGNSSSP
jgi:hypothetical protein